MSKLKHVDANHLKPSCCQCNLRDLCFAHGMDDDALKNLDFVVDQPKPLHKNDYLYRDGDKTVAIYAVRSGCIKTMMESANGDEQIVGLGNVVSLLQNDEHHLFNDNGLGMSGMTANALLSVFLQIMFNLGNGIIRVHFDFAAYTTSR